jgi:hypothetical protein
MAIQASGPADTSGVPKERNRSELSLVSQRASNWAFHAVLSKDFCIREFDPCSFNLPLPQDMTLARSDHDS